MEGRGDRGSDARAVASVLRAVAFAEERMGDDIGVEDLARAACFSPFYFSRLFAEATGHAPYDYLMRRRVAAAAEEVIGTERSLTEIALDHGFAVQDSFARAFRRCFGLLPSEARRGGAYPRQIARTRIERPYVEEMLRSPPPSPAEIRTEEAVLGGLRVDGFEPIDLPFGASALVARDGALAAGASFIGSVVAEVPAFPAEATRLAAGTRARFRVDGAAAGPAAGAGTGDSNGYSRRLAFIVEYAYRVWLPSASRPRPESFDIVARDEAGRLFLDLPLEPAAGTDFSGGG